MAQRAGGQGPAGPHLVSSVFRRLLATMPLRLLVILLGRLLPSLQSTAVPGVPLLQASGKSASGKPAAARESSADGAPAPFAGRGQTPVAWALGG